ncbi:hypothetical protein GSB9_02141 [Flavobacteriaceae bacterium GSB9]|nr:hypothetical protein GSB9_02141 [Flavobacteriaceae bacterium GSB9]
MICQIDLNQEVPFAVKAQFGFPLTVLFLCLTYINVFFLPLLLFGVLFMFSGYSYVFKADGCHKVKYKTFGFTVIEFNRQFLKPDYVSVFNQSFKQTSVLGFLEFGTSKYKSYVVKLFQGNQNIIVYKSNNSEAVLRIGEGLSNLFEIELYNALK